MIRFEQTDAGRAGAAPHERNDCVVRALALVTDRPYTEAHELLRTQGRRPGRGFKLAQWMLDVVRTGALGHRFEEVPPTSSPSGLFKVYPTLAQFIRAHQRGTFLVRVRRHAFMVKNGKVYDDRPNGARKRVRNAWKVTPL